jgi:hypothetical protein
MSTTSINCPVQTDSNSQHNLQFAITTLQFAIECGIHCKLQIANCKLQIESAKRTPRKQLTAILVTLSLLIAALAAPGCNRAFYRRQADWDAYNLIKEKATHPHWDQGRFSIAVDPRSRMFDPYCADCTPMPPDDPAAHEFMHCVDGKRGWPFWHDDGDTANIENPAWPAYLQFDDRGVLTVSSEDAVRIALLNSPNYQQNLENLYLSALDVSFERFRFDTQGFAGYETIFTADGRLRGGGNSRSVLEANTRTWQLQRAFTTGSDLVVGFANSLVWQFSGPDDFSSNTVLDFALFQPLLRNAGRERVLERLTIAERGLLGNVRAMEQYRQGFYLNVITGRNAGQGPSRSGGVIGTTQEVSTTGAAAFSLTGGQGGGGGGFAADGGAPQAGGYMGLLQDQQQIRNQEDNVERQRANLFRLEEFLVELKTRSGETGLVGNILNQDLQVAQARQALLSAESDLVSARNAYQVTLDTFKGTLGLPPQICLQVSDPMLDQFQLIDPVTMQHQRALEQIAADFGAVRQRIVSHVKTETVPDPTDPLRTRIVRVLEWYPELEQDLADLKARFEPVSQIRQSILEQYLPEIEEDLARFEAALPRRKEWLAKLRQRLAEMQNDPCSLLPVPELSEEIFSAARLDDSLAYARSQLAALAEKIGNQYQENLSGAEAGQGRIGKIDTILKEGRTWTPEKLFLELYEGVLYPKPSTEPGAAGKITDIFVEMPADIIALQLVQARARSEAVELIAIDIRAEQALEVARKYRRDWMNNRAALVNSWRNIEFVADQLSGTLDVFFSGDIGNANPNQPFSLNSDTGRLRVGVQFDAPITRLAERNAYRQALINYQQARRSYYAFEDSVARNLRGTLRTALTNQLNFEYQRQAVLIAAQQIDRNEDIRVNDELSSQGARATAARDAVSALSDLLNAQNQFLGFWVNYEVLRRGLDWDLGTFQLDSEGLWIDPGTIGEDYGKYDPWLWRTEGADCPLPLPNEIPPAEVLEQVPGHEHAKQGVGSQGSGIGGQGVGGQGSGIGGQGVEGHGGAHLEGLPPAEGIPLLPVRPVEPESAPLPQPRPAPPRTAPPTPAPPTPAPPTPAPPTPAPPDREPPSEPEGRSLQHLFPVP